MPSGRRVAVAAAAALALGATAAGCAAKQPVAPKIVAVETPTISGGVQVFQVTGLADLRFDVSTLEAKPGKIRVDFTVARGSASHDFVIPKIPAARTNIIGAGSTQSVTFAVTEPGDYPVICTLHPSMTATLHVG
ncbi:cupredoxin domain-containing protein [Frankia sp. AgB1.9]|nr:cupredoxin domain-containing protein [Frankia sp. AgW1.1]MBL7552296.1 cupredoxin domain-containing protein [Frankia sp. AgB1.9]MBL7622049.1 cupredoxin domain-containing protein [Frankia sp. AgB1.8]